MATENKDLSAYDKTKIPNAADLRIGIVVSEWNAEITEELYNGAHAALVDCGASPDSLIRWNVPGSFELVFGCNVLWKKIGLLLFCIQQGKTAQKSKKKKKNKM